MKRHRSPDSVGEASSRAKSSKAASASAETDTEAEQSSKTDQEIHITVSLRSAKKAERNDPPKLSLEEQIAAIHRESSSPQAIADTDNPRGSDTGQDPSPAGDDGLSGGQHPAQHGNPGVPAPTANPRQPSRDASSDDNNNENDDSELDDDQSDKDEDVSEDLDGPWNVYIDEEFPWYEELDGVARLEPSTDTTTASLRETQQIGSCTAKLIRRDRMRESFWTQMEEPTQETFNLAFELFDRYGRLDPEFYEHDVNKGTGVWGKELDHGDLLLFEELTVDVAYRRRGIGAKLVNAILEKTRKKVAEWVGFFALTSPGFLRSDLPHLMDDSAEMKKAQDDALEGALAFWHALGFRRVGTSSWLAWTGSPDHPSRQLAIAEDRNMHASRTAGAPLSAEMERAYQKLTDPAVEAAECIDELTKALPEDFDDVQWQATDQDGNTLLHIASMSWKPDVVSFLLARIHRLTTLRNKKGHTPVEALRDQLEHLRTRRSNGHSGQVISDAFKGFSASSISCLAALEHTSIFDLSSLGQRVIESILASTDDEIRRLGDRSVDIAGIRKALRYKYGCTCGQCIGGFLSPRMKLALVGFAENEHDNMDTFIEDSGRDWVAFHEMLLTHLPSRVRENLGTNKSMRMGFASMFNHFAKCLEQGRVPSEEGVLCFYRQHVSEWPPVTRNYLDRGGSVAAVAHAIFEGAMEQDEWAGDGTHREVFSKDIDALVACRNDHEFGFVASMCGYKKPSSSVFVDLFGRALED